MDTWFYRQFFGNLDHSRSPCHYNVPCHNLLSLGRLKGIIQDGDIDVNNVKPYRDSTTFPFYKCFPYVCKSNAVFHIGQGTVDRASQFVREKLLWNKKLHYLRPKNAGNVVKNLENAGTERVTGLNLKIHNYLQFIQTDPEPSFQGDYNWLYTGGNIIGLNFNNTDFLIFPEEIDNSVVLNTIQLDDNYNIINNRCLKPKGWFSANGPVFQILCSAKEGLIFAARQRKQINLINDTNFYIVGDSQYNIKDGAFTSCDLSLDANYLTAVDTYAKFYTFDNNVGSLVYKSKLTKEPRTEELNWFQVLFHNSNSSVYIANPTSLSILDLKEKPKVSTVYSTDPAIYDCELICNVIKSKRSQNTLYVATSHSLVEIDIRKWGSVQRWTHLMKFAPQFGKCSCRDYEELILLQSLSPDETVAIVNESGFDYSMSQYLPHILSNVKRDVRVARHNGMCLDPQLSQRLNFTYTGLDIMGSEHGTHVFTVNSGGDVFMRNLRKVKENQNVENRDLEMETGIVECLSDYNHHSLNSYSREINANYVIDMHPLQKILDTDVLRRRKKKRKRKHLDNYWNLSEMYSPESLCYFKDIMAQKVLSVWQIKLKNILDDDEEADKDKPAIGESSKEKVENWLQKWDVGN